MSGPIEGNLNSETTSLMYKMVHSIRIYNGHLTEILEKKGLEPVLCLTLHACNFLLNT